MKSLTNLNPFSVTLNRKIATLRDGSLCFSRSATAARKDMATFVRQWRAGDKQTAVKHCETSTEYESYELKRHGVTIGMLRIEREGAVEGSVAL